MRVVIEVYNVVMKRLEEIDRSGVLNFEAYYELKKIHYFASHFNKELKLQVRKRIAEILGKYKFIETELAYLDSLVDEIKKAIQKRDKKRVTELAHLFYKKSNELDFAIRNLILDKEKAKKFEKSLDKTFARFKKTIDLAYEVLC